jgi:hypothetical protein
MTTWPNAQVCGAVIAAYEKLCSFCDYHVFAVELLTDPGLSQIRSELGKALRWQFYRQHSYHLHNITEAEQLIDWFRAQDPDEVQSRAVESLIDAGLVGYPWATEVLHRVSKAVGVSQEDARAFIEDLRGCGIVRIEWMPESPEPDMIRFPRLCWWAACDPKEPT